MTNVLQFLAIAAMLINGAAAVTHVYSLTNPTTGQKRKFSLVAVLINGLCFGYALSILVLA